jgi:hypothetical protein
VKRPSFYVDFNEMVEPNLVLLSQTDVKNDYLGRAVELSEGMQVDLYMDDVDSLGNRDDLVASGTVERNSSQDWSKHVKWCCRIDSRGVRHRSEL